jgi:hypothetical protein
MTRQYTPRNVLRQVPNFLLKDFFDQRAVLTEIPWALQHETKIEPIYDAWQALPESKWSQIDGAFQAIHEMASQSGVQALIEEGTFHGLNFSTALEQHEGFYDKAMWAYLHYPDIFNVASLFVSADGLPGRYWFHHKSLPRKIPNTSSQGTRAFADALSEYFRTEQGRGHRCTVETYLRGGRQHYFLLIRTTTLTRTSGMTTRESSSSGLRSGPSKWCSCMTPVPARWLSTCKGTRA